MKHILFVLMMLAGLSGSAGEPETNRITKTTYNLEPEPPKPSPNDYLYECCGTIHYWNEDRTCLVVLLDCWGACAGHFWRITCCKDGTRTIEGSLLVPDKPKKVEVPLSTAISADKFDPSLDPVSQATEYKRIENSIINVKDQLVLETDESIFIFAPGRYQIIDSKLMVLATKTQP